MDEASEYGSERIGVQLFKVITMSWLCRCHMIMYWMSAHGKEQAGV